MFDDLFFGAGLPSDGCRSGRVTRGCADSRPADDPAAYDARVTMLTTDPVEPARSTAYGGLGDGRRALTITMRWLAPKLG